jgi:uncharacterized protein YjdB
MKHTLHHERAAYAPPAGLPHVDAMKTDSNRSYLLRLMLFVAAGLLMLAPKANAQKKTAPELRREHEVREQRERRERAEQAANSKERDGKGVSKTTKGRETLKGELDFARMAAWELQHPSVAHRKVENEEDENDLVIQKYKIDPLLVKQKHSSPMMMAMVTAPAPDMPVSSTASDSFQAVLDNGTTIPPDTHGAVDSNYVVTATNTTVRIMTKTHTSISQVSLDNFWSPVLSGGGSFDPRVHYDPYSARWIIVTVCGGQSSSSSILIAVSKTSNPTSGWWMYKVGSTGASGTDWLDYPNVGYNGKWLVVTGNYFSISGGTYTGANAWFFNYANLKAGGSASYTSINQGTSAFTLCPALTYSSSLQSMYLVDHYNYTVGAVRLWKVTGAVGSEVMTQIAIPNSGMPWTPQGPGSGADFAPQLGTTNLIQNNDHRINQMIYINGKLWFSHNVFLPYGAPTHTGIQWWQIDTAGTPLQVGRVEDASGANFYAFPSIAVNANDDALIGFSAFSATTYPSAAYALRLHTDATDSIRTPFRYRTGKNTYFKNFGLSRDRWGDYSGTCVDPSNMTDFWTVQEASAATVNTWDTWWAKVTVAGCSVASITGTATVCQGKTTTLADATSGGTWSTGSSIISVNSTTGVVTGNSAGTATVSYTVSAGCYATTVVTVNANPAVITGSTTVCTGATITLSDATTGGTWGSANPAIASITSGGVVTGVATGSTTITYSLSTGCLQTVLMQVNSTPAPITGTATLCTGTTTSLSTTPTGGTWSSSTTGVATINATSGVVTGVAAGTATISYTLSSGCRSTKVVTVSATPAAIGGTTTLCLGGTTTLTNTTTGGSWISANSTVATVGSSNGVVTGVSNGSTTISYIMSGGCYQTAFVMVNQAPSAISGGNAVCAGSSITLTNATTGGTWSSSNTGIATIGSATGVVGGLTAGTTTISYVLSTGCRATMTMSVVSQPAVITGITSACIGGTTTLSDATTGGSWSSGNPTVATVTSGGVVTGVNTGSATITYALGSGCFRTTVVTISTSASAITGTMAICAGSTLSLSDSTAGGSWSSSASAVATVGSATGVVTGVSAGTATISYNLTGSCSATTVVTVLAMPAAITGTATVCQGAMTTLSTTTSGGSWTSSNSDVAAIGTSGVVTGGAAGIVTITYMLANGCYRTAVVTVNATPVISGTPVVCVGATTSLTSSITGAGTWTSSSTAASVNATSGVVTGAAAGTTIITFTTAATGCKGFMVVTVNPIPAAITGTAVVCEGATTTFADVTTEGTWSSSNTGVITIGSTGVAPGIGAGTATITYMLTTGCARAIGVTVNSLPAAITGTTTLCAGTTTSLSSTTTGGTWSSASTAVATVGSTTGVVTGVADGSTTITYKLSTGCYQTTMVFVNPGPTAITGSSSVCIGNAITLADATTGGSWSTASSNVSVGASTGIVNGITAGTATITYSIGVGCVATKVVTVSTQAIITGGTALCIGGTTSLAGSPTGGAWSSMSTAIATVGTTTGVVTGVSAGSTAITYALNAGCMQTAWVMVNAAPAAIGGTATVCAGGTTTLTNAVSGGSWSSTASNITIDAETGVVTAIGIGTATVTYSMGSCTTTKVVTVNATPTIASGMAVCVGGTATFSATPTGGTWSSGNTAVATIVSSTGVMTGVAAGSVLITYKITSTGCSATSDVSIVNPTPGAITGTAAVCVGSTTTLTDSTTGGIWISTSANISLAASTGLVTGLTAGTATVSYTLGTGCRVTKVVTVNANPAAITGNTTVCVGSTTALTSTTTGGTWSSASTSIATVSSTGVVTGVSAGSTAISYTLTTGCYQVAYVMVNPTPPTISGAGAVCIGSSISLFDDVEGGTWSSTSTNVSVGSSTGIVTGITAGTATVSYTLSSGCRTTKIITINALPAVITGTAATCVGSTTLLSDGTTGGAWSSADTTIASFGTSGGAVTGVSAGTVTVSYTLTTGCYRTTIVTVNPTPSAISGPSTICAGSSATFTDSTSGGTWSSSLTAVATIGSATGVLTAVAAGVANISYTVAGGCRAIRTVTVNALPSAITGTASVCLGATTTLSSTPAGGLWTSGNTDVAFVSSGGVVSGLSVGTTTITYTLSTGCTKSITVTVNSLPVIAGYPIACVGSTTSLTGSPTGGTWSSGTTAIATVVSTTGVVTGVATGSALITYTASGTACKAAVSVLVNGLPGAIGGTLKACPGTTTTLSDTAAGGMWSVANTAVATIDSATGIATGVAAGTATVTYRLATGCFKTAVLTVNPLPAAITGATSACVGATTLLNNATGSWSSSDMTVATVNASHIVTGISAGTATITFALPTGCITTTVVTINPLPSAITGNSILCAGSMITLSDSLAGGTWSTSAATVATVGSVSGGVTGINAGNATITYLLPTGCRTSIVVTVSVFQPITGITNACVGMTTTLSSTTTGGSWASGNTDVATVGSTGIVTGLTAGTVTITYTLASGCYRTASVTINPVPTAIAGSGAVCPGSTLSLSDDVVGGSWTTSTPSVATVGSATGVVAGVAAGTAVITYTVGSGCRTTTIITVNAQPAAITGATSACVGAATTLSETSTGGSWYSSDPGTATVSSTGIVTGVATGTVSVGYMFPTGCYRAVVITVNAAPAAIGGTLSVCQGSTTSLTNSTSGGSWSSSSSIATIGSGTGVATGVTAGTVIVTYAAGGCRATAVLTVLAAPAAITGTMAVCSGATTALGSTTTGGSWFSGSPSIASIGVSTGIVTGVSSGIATVTYLTGNGCYRTAVVTVNTTPSLFGTFVICQGGTSSAFSTTAGGMFSSSNSSVAAIDSTGAISGVTAGIATITYMMPTGCFTTAVVTVSPNPAAITGIASTYVGGSTTLSDATAGGTWSGSDPSIGGVGSATGIVTGISAGSLMVSYTLSTGCSASILVNVSALSGIGGTLAVCEGGATTLTNGVGGGTWQSGDGSIATVDVSSGVVTGVAAGTVNISYITSGSATSVVVTVNPTPSSIGSSLVVCAGGSTSLSSSPTGGAWSSGVTSVATIGSSTGVANGVSAGTTVISYMLSTGCFATASLVVNPVPTAITGSSSVPSGSTITLASTTTGGAWTGSDSTIATVGSTTGIVTGMSIGSVIISYTLTTGCFATKLINVGAPVAPITGTASVCVGSTTALTHPVSGGTWTSGDITVATVSSTGVVTGVSAGTATISYALPTGGMATADVTVNATPLLTGSLTLCASTTTSLSASITGGTWNSSVTSVATVDVNGVVSGLLAGTSTISYTLGTGCYAIGVVTVIAGPSVISGTTSLCVGSTTALHNVTTGTWSSSDTTVATVGLTTGVVNGLAAGNATITFTVSSGCYQTAVVNVNAAPSAVTGTLSTCVGSAAMLTDATTSGTWSSGSTSIATIDASTGIYTGVSIGVSNVTYTVASGCKAIAQVTINVVPTTIGGTLSLCAGATTTLTNGIGGGSWSSSDSTTATVSSTGVVIGVTAGAAIITYATTSGCYKTATVTVNALPVAASGTSVCVGLTTTVTATPAGGTWSTVGSTTATITSAGVVTGIAAGTGNVTYTLPGGCKTTTVVVVSGLPAAITGTTRACPGATTVLSDAVTGGTWISADPSTVTIGITDGTVTGVATGTATVTYTTGAGCYKTTIVTVSAGPSTIGGSLTVCAGFPTTLTNTLAGGVWATSNAAVATMSSSTGIASGVSAGTATISYTSGTGCIATAILTVTSLPTITGTPKVCSGSTTSLSASIPGGTWTSASSSVISIDPSTGVMTGISGSGTTITYSLGAGCYKAVFVTVNAAPPVITGYTTVCIGTNTTLTSGSGTWSSSNTAAGTVNLNIGAVIGIAAGTTTITFMQTTGCFQTATVTVNPPVPAITGTAVTCSGSTTTLTDSLPGGTWSTANVAVATVGSTTGIVTGVGSGTVLISYNFGSGCRVTRVYTANSLPAVIGGASSAVCVGATITLTDITSGGTWSSSNSSLATVGSVVNAGTGRVAGVSAGTVDITYTITSTGCFRSRNVTVNAASAGVVSGPATVIMANTITLASTVAGGAWSSADGSIATVDPTSGVVTGVGAGIVNISYTVTSACGTFVATYPISVTTSRPGGNNSAPAISLSLYPNPTSGSFIVTSPEAGTLTVYALDGKAVAQYPVKAAMNEFALPHGVAAGVYMCRFNGVNGGSVMVRLEYEQ